MICPRPHGRRDFGCVSRCIVPLKQSSCNSKNLEYCVEVLWARDTNCSQELLLSFCEKTDLGYYFQNYDKKMN